MEEELSVAGLCNRNSSYQFASQIHAPSAKKRKTIHRHSWHKARQGKQSSPSAHIYIKAPINACQESSHAQK